MPTCMNLGSSSYCFVAEHVVFSQLIVLYPDHIFELIRFLSESFKQELKLFSDSTIQ